MPADAARGGTEPRPPSAPGLGARGRSNRELLEDAAWELFNERPYRQVGVAEVAARAGVSTGSFYSYFDSKEELFRVAAGRALEAMYEEHGADPQNIEGDPIVDVAHGIGHYFEACRTHRVIARSIEELWLLDDGVRLVRRGTLMRGAKRLQRWIADLQDKGICPSGIDPWFTALALQAMAVHLALDQVIYRDKPQDIETLTGTVVPIWAKAVGLERWLPTT